MKKLFILLLGAALLLCAGCAAEKSETSAQSNAASSPLSNAESTISSAESTDSTPSSSSSYRQISQEEAIRRGTYPRRNLCRKRGYFHK